MATRKEILSQNLQRLLLTSHRNQAQLADICGVSKGSFGDWVHGRTFPRPEKLRVLANALGVSEQDLITDVETKELYLNADVMALAKQLSGNIEARDLLLDILNLEPQNMIVAKQVVSSLSKKEKREP